MFDASFLRPPLPPNAPERKVRGSRGGRRPKQPSLGDDERRVALSCYSQCKRLVDRGQGPAEAHQQLCLQRRRRQHEAGQQQTADAWRQRRTRTSVLATLQAQSLAAPTAQSPAPRP